MNEKVIEGLEGKVIQAGTSFTDCGGAGVNLTFTDGTELLVYVVSTYKNPLDLFMDHIFSTLRTVRIDGAEIIVEGHQNAGGELPEERFPKDRCEILRERERIIIRERCVS